MKQIILIPAYNEAAVIASVLQAVREAAPDFDVVVVNDGSTDETARIVRALRVPLLSLPCNLGYARALQTGLRYAAQKDYETIVCMDADGQHDAQAVQILVAALRQSDADLVLGSRFIASKTRALSRIPLGRRIGMLFFSLATQLLSHQRIYDTTSGFKVMRASTARALLQARFVDFHAEVLVYLSLLGYRIREVPIPVRARITGVSMHSWLSAFTYPLQTLLILLLAVTQARFNPPPPPKESV
jgi:glycosyltransferase involved in cell wall biosynthesis